MLRDYWKLARSSHPAAIIAVEVTVSTILVLSFLMFFFYVAEDVFRQQTLSLDLMSMRWISGIHSPHLTDVMVQISSLGEAPSLTVQAILLLLYLWRRRRRDALIFIGILITGAALNVLLKNLFVRERPSFPLLFPATGYSFPSGHAMNSFIFYASAAYFLYRETKQKIMGLAMTLTSSLLIALIGFSRLYLNLHYFSDIIAGYCAGFVWFTSAIVFEKIVILRRLLNARRDLL